MSAEDLDAREELGTLINYNGYGPTLDDLHFHPQPAILHIKIYPDDFHPAVLCRQQPGSHVGVVVEARDHDLIPFFPFA